MESALTKYWGRLGECLLAQALLASCSASEEPDYDLPPLRWEGERVRFATDYDDADVCRGNLWHIDAYVGAFQGFSEGTSVDVIDYYWLRKAPSAYGPPCPGSACAIANQVFTRRLPNEHEVIHAVRHDGAARFFEEGIAMYWGDDIEAPVSLGGDVGDAIVAAGAAEVPSTADYVLAGHFVAFLVERFGAGAVLSLGETTDESDELAAVEQGFQEAFGVPLDDTIAEYEADYPKCEHLVYRSAFFECGQAPILVCEGDQSSQELALDVSCANEQALGPRDGTMWLDVSIELARSGAYLIRGYENPGIRGGFVRLKRCASACQGTVFEAETAWPDDDFPDAIYEELSSGRYVLQVHQLADQQGEVRIEITCP